MKRPPSLIRIAPDLCLRVSKKTDAQAHLNVLNANRVHLKPFMPWAHWISTVEQYEAFIASVRTARRKGTEFGYQIELGGHLIGRVSLLNLEYKNDKAEIGYWITLEHQGKGIITRAVQILIQLAQDTLGIHRVEIRCAVGNRRSSNIPKRLGFQMEGILKHAEKYEQGYRDLELWALVRT